MLGLIISCAFWACILVIICQAFTDDEVAFSDVFKTSLIATVVAGILAALATAPMENEWLKLATEAFIVLLTTAVVVQFVCATDVKTVVKIALTYTAIRVVLALAITFFVYPMLAD